MFPIELEIPWFSQGRGKTFAFELDVDFCRKLGIITYKLPSIFRHLSSCPWGNEKCNIPGTLLFGSKSKEDLNIGDLVDLLQFKLAGW